MALGFNEILEAVYEHSSILYGPTSSMIISANAKIKDMTAAFFIGTIMTYVLAYNLRQGIEDILGRIQVLGHPIPYTS